MATSQRRPSTRISKSCSRPLEKPILQRTHNNKSIHTVLRGGIPDCSDLWIHANPLLALGIPQALGILASPGTFPKGRDVLLPFRRSTRGRRRGFSLVRWIGFRALLRVRDHAFVVTIRWGPLCVPHDGLPGLGIEERTVVRELLRLRAAPGSVRAPTCRGTRTDRDGALTISVTSPSSGLGSESKRRIVDRSVETFNDGFQHPLGGMFNVSRQILPPESMFGW